MKYIVFLFIFLSRLCFAQMHDNNWLIGKSGIAINSYQLNFNAQLHIDTISQSLKSTFDIFPSISDYSGNLLFYANSCTINNSLHQPVLDSLCVCDTCWYWYSTMDMQLVSAADYNNVLFIPHPDSAHLYYLFYQTLRDPLYEYLAKNLYCTTLDTRGNGGLGSVKTEKMLLTTTTANQKLAMNQLTATKHANGKDWWLVQPLADTTGFISFLIKNDTIIKTSIQYPTNTKFVAVGYSAFSPNGKIYARVSKTNVNGLLHIEIYDFNRCNGKLHNRRLVFLPSVIIGGGHISISPNNRFLYVSATYGNQNYGLYQYDLFDTDIENSVEKVGSVDTANQICPIHLQPNACTGIGMMKLTADNRIFNVAGFGFLNIINNLNEKGLACNFQAHSLNLPTITTLLALPNFPNYRTPAIPESERWTNEEEQGGGIISSVEETEAGAVKLYPNPASEAITLEISDIGGITIEIVDMLGRVLSTTISSQKSTVLSLQQLSAGVYSCRVRSEQGVWVKQFIISK